MDILGLTFAEVRSALAPRVHEVKKLREEYRGLLIGQIAANGYGLRADVLPVARSIVDGDLIKFVQQTPDGWEIESVCVPMQRYGQSWKTLCVSSQIGCARGCVFCETGQLGLRRNLTPAEIVGQVVAARTQLGQVIRNVVFMGMGEPFDNFDNVTQAVRVLTDRSGLSMSCERVSISTVGRTDGIRRLAALGWRRINLAVSLNAPNDAIRSRLMPVNRRHGMAELRAALLRYPLRGGVFLAEYVLFRGVNDRREHAAELAAWLRPFRACVNLIACNPTGGSAFQSPTAAEVERFKRWLNAEGQYARRRETKGRRIAAGCGQLASGG